MGDGGVVLQWDDVQFIGIIVYIYDSKKRYKLSCILPKMGVLAKVCFGYKLVTSNPKTTTTIWNITRTFHFLTLTTF